MAGLFAKARKNAAAAQAVSKSDEVVWVADGDVGNSVREIVELDRKISSIGAQLDTHKSVVKRFANEMFSRECAALGFVPDAPYRVRVDGGEQVTFVVQDRSGQYPVKDDQERGLENLVGVDVADDLIYDEVSYSFNREIMAIPGVAPMVERALEVAIKKLIMDGVLIQEQADMLVEAKSKRSFIPRILDSMTRIVGCDSGRILKFLDVMGSSITRYVKT